MLDFINSQWAYIPVPKKDFSGQTVIVTGSNIGLGLEAARHLTRLNAAKVILACRSIDKGKEAKVDIVNSIKDKDVASRIEVWELDLGSFDSVKAFAKKCESLDRLDVVIENAGVAMYHWSKIDDTETTIRINVESTFLLALLLLPILRKSGKKTGNTPVLTITSSEVHGWAKFAEAKADKIFDELKVEKKAYIDDRYQVSKLIEVMVVRELADKMTNGSHANEKVILNTVNPGLCHSSLSRNIKGFQSFIFATMKALLARTTEVGGRTLVWSAAGDESTHGQYMSTIVVTPPYGFMKTAEAPATQKKVYSELMEILERVQPGITENI